MSAVWGHTYFSTPDHLSVHVHRIRRAIEDAGGSPDHIETVRGVGYMYVSDPRARPSTVTLHFGADSRVLAIVPFAEFLGWSPDLILGRYFSVVGLDPIQSSEALQVLRSVKVLHGPDYALRGDGLRQAVIETISLDDTFVPDGYKSTLVYAEDVRDSTRLATAETATVNPPRKSVRDHRLR